VKKNQERNTLLYIQSFLDILLMRLSVLLVIVFVLIAACCLFTFQLRENFLTGDSIHVAWTPSGPNPQDIAYNWGVCISHAADQTTQGLCSSQNPAYPPGPPGANWNYHGQTPKGQNSLTLNNLNCSDCDFGMVLTLLLQAVDVASPSTPASAWTSFTLDLSSKATALRSVIHIPNSSQPISPGSTEFRYTLQLNQPVMAPPNDGVVRASLVRGSQTFSYTDQVPFNDGSIDPNVRYYTGSFTTSGPSSPWSPSAPGALQSGDVLTVESLVYSPGSSQQSGEVYFTGSISQTATAITPTAPTGVSWTITA
jgi:hypothetical protein